MGADRFRRLGETRVVMVDQHLGDQGDGAPVQAAGPHLVMQGALEHEADGALQVGAGVVHGHRRHLVDGQLGTAHDETDLPSLCIVVSGDGRGRCGI